MAAILPRLSGPDGPASPSRRVSDTQVRIDGADAVDSGGGQTQPDLVAGTMAIIPSGEEDLAWAVYTLGGLDAERPVELEIEVQAIIPSGDDDLAYWVLYSDYSLGRWRLAPGPNPDGSYSGTAAVPVVLNSAERRERVVSAASGSSSQSRSPSALDAEPPIYSYVIVVMGNADNSLSKPPDEQPRIIIEHGDTTLRNLSDPGYFRTKPMPARIDSADADPHTGAVTVAFATDGGADRLYVQRRIAGTGDSWVELGFAPTDGGNGYTDPDDNTEGDAPQLGLSYDYRAVAATLDGGDELRAGYSNQQNVVMPNSLLLRAVLQADATVGDAPLTVNFDASGSSSPNGSIIDYEWDFDGNGVFNEAGEETAARGNSTPAAYTYAAPGSFTVSVRVTDDGSATHIASLTVTVRGWRVLFVDQSLDQSGGYNSLAVVNGKPAISHLDETNFDLKYTWSSTVDGADLADWSTLTVDEPNSVGFYSSLAVVNGKPAISYIDQTSANLKYAWSSAPDGAGGWASLIVDDTSGIGQYSSLALLADGRPAISYYDQSNSDLRYAWSSTADGADQADWNKLIVDSAGTVGQSSSLALFDGRPAIGYRGNSSGGLKYAWSSTADGADQADWSNLIVDMEGNAGMTPSLALVNGTPAMSYYDNGSNDLRYAWSGTMDGSSGWSTLIVAATGNVGDSHSLALVGGTPAIAYRDITNEAVMYARSNTAQGADPAHWSHMTVDQGGILGWDLSLTVLANGRPAISYRDHTNRKLKYAVLIE